MNKFTQYLILSCACILASNSALCPQPAEVSANEFTNTAVKSYYAEHIPFLRLFRHHKTSSEINGMQPNRIPAGITYDWDNKVQELEDLLQQIDTIRNNYADAFAKAEPIYQELKSIKEKLKAIKGMKDETSKQERKEKRARRDELKKQINNEIRPLLRDAKKEINPLKEMYQQKKSELFELLKSAKQQ